MVQQHLHLVHSTVQLRDVDPPGGNEVGDDRKTVY